MPPSASSAWSNRMDARSAKRSAWSCYLQFLDQGMLKVDFEHGFDVGHGLPCLLQQARQLQAHALVLRHQAGG